MSFSVNFLGCGLVYCRRGRRNCGRTCSSSGSDSGIITRFESSVFFSLRFSGFGQFAVGVRVTVGVRVAVAVVMVVVLLASRLITKLSSLVISKGVSLQVVSCGRIICPLLLNLGLYAVSYNM